MTHEQAGELAKILQAYSEEKPLEIFLQSKWIDYIEDEINETFAEMLLTGVCFRIKPERKKIALTMQDLIDRELKKETIRLSNSELILSWNHNFVTTINNTYGYSYLLDHGYTFLDGSPCYKEVQE